jgi:thiamine transport system substrate-binding protein
MKKLDTHLSLLPLFTLIILLFSSCQPLAAPDAAQPAATPTLVVATHDSFSIGEEIVQEFEQANNVKVQFLALGDAGEALNKIILSKDAPLADVFFGVDNTFLGRALEADIFEPFAAQGVAAVASELRLDPQDRLLPVDFGFVNINADKAWFAERHLPLPQTLEDLTAPAYKGLLVVENPATSSPGLAFLLATIAHLGEDGAFQFWQALADNDVLVADGWSEAYFEHFTVGSSGSGNRPLVVSYSTSPPADVLYATDGRTEPASVNINVPGGAFRQVEFVGVLKGAQQPELARRWVEYMLSERFQNDIPLQMFVYPVNPNARLPELFQQFAAPVANAMTLAAAEIEANREDWIARWTEIMVR